jgi:DNA-binding transcriptional LysR family regulator
MLPNLETLGVIMKDINRLKVFLHVADTLSFTEAARQLHVSQPTVSKHIRDLESELDVQLFDRSGAKPQLTNAGMTLIPWARKLLRQTIEMKELMASMQSGVVGQLRIACSTTAGKYVLPQLAARFRQRYPGIHVSILACTSQDVVIRLLEGEAHLGVISREVFDPGLECQAFFSDSITLIVPADHPWAFRGSIEPEELLEEPILIREDTSGTRRVMLEELAKFDITLDDINVFLELGNAEAIVRTVAAGYGVSFVSTLAMACPLERGNVITIPVRGLDLRRRIFMVRKSLDTPHRPQEVFWSFIHDPANVDLIQLPGSVSQQPITKLPE